MYSAPLSPLGQGEGREWGVRGVRVRVRHAPRATRGDTRPHQVGGPSGFAHTLHACTPTPSAATRARRLDYDD